MPKMTTIDSFKRDNILLEFMKEHRGKRNNATSKEIADFLNSRGYETNTASVHSMVKRVMYERNAPICHINSKGYYWATSRDEIEATIADLEMRRVALQEHIDHLKNFIIG